MIYGYEIQTMNEFGLKQMREISLELSSEQLRELAGFLLSAAHEIECEVSPGWHRHLPSDIRKKIGCDVIVWESKASISDDEEH